MSTGSIFAAALRLPHVLWLDAQLRSVDDWVRGGTILHDMMRIQRCIHKVTLGIGMRFALLRRFHCCHGVRNMGRQRPLLVVGMLASSEDVGVGAPQLED